MAWASTTVERSSIQTSKSGLATDCVQAPWTAARCQRVLRQLSSKIALLRKERQFPTEKGEVQQSHGVTLKSVSVKSSDRGYCQSSRRRTPEAIKIADEEWAPNPRPRKRLKRTYSSRSLGSQRPGDASQPVAAELYSRNPTEITVPDCFFNSEGQHDAEADAAESAWNIDAEHKNTVRRNEPQTQRNGALNPIMVRNRPGNRYKVKLPFEAQLVEGIYKWVEALLKSTGRSKPSRGARALFTTCLHRVPDYIGQEEQRYKAEDPESDIDVSCMIYSDLESLGCSSMGGWEPLRQVVRAHGISMVGSAIREALIGVTDAAGIVFVCHRLGARKEAQHLLHSLLESIEPWQRPSKDALKPRMILTTLDRYVQATGSQTFRYKELAWLLGSGRLPSEWIARHDMIETWNRVVQSITQGDEHAGPAAELLQLATTMTWGLSVHDPATFVHGIRLRRSRFEKKANKHIVSLGYKTHWPKSSQTDVGIDGEAHRDEKASSTISSLMTVLCAIGLLRSAKTTSDSSTLHPSELTALQDIAIKAQQMLELVSAGMFPIPDGGMTVVLLAAGLVQATLCRNRQEFEVAVPAFFDRLSRFNRNGSAVEEGGSFLCAVAECCAKAASDSVFDHTQKVVQHIRHIGASLGHGSASYELCNCIGLATAVEFADTSKHPKHLHWALDVEQAVTGAHLESARRTPAKTPLRGQGQCRNGYRWEAGICEWVARTPAMTLPGHPAHVQRGMPMQRMGVGSRATLQEDALSSLESSFDSSSESNSAAAPQKRFRRGRNCRRMGVDEVTIPDECSATNMFFSHVRIENEGDELSHLQKRHRLREITNVGSGLKREDAGQKQRAETHKRHGKKSRSCEVETLQCADGGIGVVDVALDSEDELSFYSL
ncbi:MAG: hypothetical protein Q9179_006789 [Wetmoreana sp. 5 TL-2023]